MLTVQTSSLMWIKKNRCLVRMKDLSLINVYLRKVSEYDQEIPILHTTDQPKAS